MTVHPETRWMSINRVSLYRYTIWFSLGEPWQQYRLVEGSLGSCTIWSKKIQRKDPSEIWRKCVNLSMRFARRGSYGRHQDLRRQLDG